jgi:hypothetical protein
MARKREAEWKETEQRWESAPTNSTSGGWGPVEDDSRWVGSDEQLFITLYDMYRGVWPSAGRGIEGIEVVIDVHSVLEGSLDKERSACRSLYPLITFQFLTYLASYDIVPSVLPMEVAHPVVPVEELTRSSSPASMLPAALSEVLGMSLSDVMDRYFDGSEESERVHRIEEALDRRREFEEGEEWLARESHKMEVMLEQIHWGQDDDLF